MPVIEMLSYSPLVFIEVYIWVVLCSEPGANYLSYVAIFCCEAGGGQLELVWWPAAR